MSALFAVGLIRYWVPPAIPDRLRHENGVPIAAENIETPPHRRPLRSKLRDKGVSCNGFAKATLRSLYKECATAEDCA